MSDNPIVPPYSHLDQYLQGEHEPGVYVAYYEQMPGSFKIGITFWLGHRLHQIALNQPFVPRCLHFIPAHNHMIAGYLEADLHKRLWDRHIRGEWFRLTQNDIQAILRIDRITVYDLTAEIKAKLDSLFNVSEINKNASRGAEYTQRLSAQEGAKHHE
jgi:hypothetical protein